MFTDPLRRLRIYSAKATVSGCRYTLRETEARCEDSVPKRSRKGCPTCPSTGQTQSVPCERLLPRSDSCSASADACWRRGRRHRVGCTGQLRRDSGRVRSVALQAGWPVYHGPDDSWPRYSRCAQPRRPKVHPAIRAPRKSTGRRRSALAPWFADRGHGNNTPHLQFY